MGPFCHRTHFRTCIFLLGGFLDFLEIPQTFVSDLFCSLLLFLDKEPLPLLLLPLSFQTPLDLIPELLIDLRREVGPDMFCKLSHFISLNLALIGGMLMINLH